MKKWTFKNLEIIYKSGEKKVVELEIVNQKDTSKPEIFTKSQRAVREWLHDELYKLKGGENISYIKLLNVKYLEDA